MSKVKTPFILSLFLLIVFASSIARDAINVPAKVNLPQESWHYRSPTIDKGRISQLDNSFGKNCGHAGEGRFMDINGEGSYNTDEGMPVYAVGDGTIDFVGYASDYGNYVELISFGVRFLYAHLDKVYVSQGNSVKQGDLIGLLGNTGMASYPVHYAHLHWGAQVAETGAPYDGIFDIQNIEEFSTGTNPCDWPGTITAESLDVNHWYHPEGTPLDSGCPNYFNKEAELRSAGLYHVTVFDHSDCLGNSKMIFAPGSYNLDSMFGFNDRMRSIYIPPKNPVLGIQGWSVKLYAYNNSGALVSSCRTVDMWNMDKDTYEGPSGIKIGWDPNFTDASNMVSRIDVFDNPTCTPPPGGLPMVAFTEIGGIGGSGGPIAPGDTVTVHADPPYTGTRYGWHDAGKYNLTDYMINKITSVGVTSGWSIALFDGLDQTGPYICVNANDADLNDNNLSNGTNANDKAESVIVFNNGNCSGMDLPDLAAEEVFVSLTTGTTTFEILNTNQPAYIDWHFENVGSTAASGQFYADLWINDTRYVHYSFSNIGSQVRLGFDDWDEIVPDSGWLKVRLVIDPDNTITELDESNNIWEKHFFWNAPDFLETLGCSNVTDPGVILAEDAYCGGNYEYLLLPGTRNLTTVNESVSALRILPGISAMVYKDANLSGQKMCFNGNIEDLSLLTWPDGSSMNNSISSFEVFFNEYCITQGSSVGQLVLYGAVNYQSSATSFNLEGPYNLPSNVDNSISSMDIVSGWSVMLYDGYNQSGSSVCKNSDDPDFGTDTYDDGSALNDTVSSIELFSYENCQKTGDANGDGKVDGIDYVIWLNHYNQAANNGPSEGDFNSDGFVDGVDYVIWLINYGN